MSTEDTILGVLQTAKAMLDGKATPQGVPGKTMDPKRAAIGKLLGAGTKKPAPTKLPTAKPQQRPAQPQNRRQQSNSQQSQSGSSIIGNSSVGASCSFSPTLRVSGVDGVQVTFNAADPDSGNNQLFSLLHAQHRQSVVVVLLHMDDLSSNGTKASQYVGWLHNTGRL